MPTNLIGANPLQKRIFRSITSAIWKQKETMWTTHVPILNWMDVHSWPITKFLTWQRWKIYISKWVFPKAVYSGPQFTRQYFIEKSIHLPSLWQLKHFLCQTICARAPLVEILLSCSFAYVGMPRAVIIILFSYFIFDGEMRL